MILATTALRHMRVKDWDDRLVHPGYWKWERIPPTLQGKGVRWTFRIQCTLSGYEHIYSDHQIDDAFIIKAEGDEEYIKQYILKYFFGYLMNAKKKIDEKKQQQLGIIKKTVKPQVNPDIQIDNKAQNEAKQRKYELRQKMKRLRG